MSGSHTSMKISKKRTETSDSASFFFDVNDKQRSEWDFKAGQYITLRMYFEGQKLPVKRAYSLCTSPLSSDFGFCVKRVDGGLVSNYLIDEVTEGDEIEIVPPLGNFILDETCSLEKDVVFLAAGSGITPIYSMIDFVKSSAKDWPSCPSLHLLYLNKSEEDIIFKKDLSTESSVPLRIQHFLTRQEEVPSGFMKGRISVDTIRKYVEENGIDTSKSIFYVCGPTGLLNTVQEYFDIDSIDKDRLRFELFNADADSSSTEVDSDENVFDVKVNLDGEEFIVPVGRNENIIQKMIDADIDAPYTCLNGTCSSCMAQKVSGELEMRKSDGLSKDEVEEGFVLACQCAPLAEGVEVDFDY